MIRETLEGMDVGDFVLFNPSEVEGQSVRSVASRLKGADIIFTTKKTSKGYEVSRLK